MEIDHKQDGKSVKSGSAHHSAEDREIMSTGFPTDSYGYVKELERRPPSR